MKKTTRTPARPVRRRPPLDRAAIAAAALELIDKEGLENLSMRRLGAALGVEAMAIYHHFESKGELTDAILDLFIEEVEPPLLRSSEPLVRLRACFDALRGIAITHPRAFWVLPARRFRTLRALQFYERLLQTFDEAGFDAAAAARFFRLAAGFAMGAGMAEIGSRAQQPDATPVILEDFSDPEHFPHVSRVVPHLRVANLDAIYKFGMDTIFDAMRRWLESDGVGKARGTKAPLSPALSRKGRGRTGREARGKKA
jgi:AcrR family transcriptional regulator